MSEYDFSLPISFSLAAEIGLEEAVLLAFLRQKSYLSRSSILQCDIRNLLSQLPFWTQPMLLRVLSSLQLNQCLTFDKKQSLIEVKLFSKERGNDRNSEVEQANTTTKRRGNQTDSLVEKVEKLATTPKKSLRQESVDRPPLSQSDRSHSNSMAMASNRNNANYSHMSNERRRGVTDFDLYLEQKERTRQPDQWQPEEATLEQILQSGVPRGFALQLQDEFLLRIKEQRKNVRTWNSEFFKYVKRQWQYKQSDRSSNEGTTSSTHTSKTSREKVSDALTNIHDTDW
ncbi:DnaT-like ssDNA-binding domain-containing protein [Marinomonas sp. 2405UD68-3]|uniref:DnaT-like ssDNA-binding domain-containing protein n=1 Tax=Marinomonas sp. 2405UD68-3 TaxID=3391835 RepID=UPI0039C99700